MVKFFVALITPLASRIQVSSETKFPSCGAYPAVGPRRFGLDSLASAITGGKSAAKRADPVVTAADRRRKLLRLEPYSLEKSLPGNVYFRFVGMAYPPSIMSGFPSSNRLQHECVRHQVFIVGDSVELPCSTASSYPSS